MTVPLLWMILVNFLAPPVPEYPASPVGTGDRGTGGFELILPGIYRLQDAGNVYLLRSGTEGILIDAGSDNLAVALEETGVDKIDWVLHTHFHRDQCMGTTALGQAGAGAGGDQQAIPGQLRAVLEPDGVAREVDRCGLAEHHLDVGPLVAMARAHQQLGVVDGAHHPIAEAGPEVFAVIDGAGTAAEVHQRLLNALKSWATGR